MGFSTLRSICTVIWYDSWIINDRWVYDNSSTPPAPFPSELLRFGLSVWSFRVSSTQAGSFSPLLKPSLLHTLPSRRRCVGRYGYWTIPSVRGFLYDVHDCWVDRHKRRPAPSKGQVWWPNRSPCNSANLLWRAILVITPDRPKNMYSCMFAHYIWFWKLYSLVTVQDCTIVPLP